jgi:ABC-2 type transport system permease protein
MIRRAVPRHVRKQRVRRAVDHAVVAAAVAIANPVTHLTNAVRDLMGGRPAAREAGWVLLASLAIAAVIAPLTAWLYRRR